MILLVNSDSIRIPLANESVHCVVTSPPYWGLRDYDLPPLIWGDEAGCRHVWGGETVRKYSGGTERAITGQHKDSHTHFEASQGQFCQLCNAWRGCLGLEPTVGLYVQHLVEVFREVWRVLRKDGTVWLNLGSSYNSGSQFNHHAGNVGQRYNESPDGKKWSGHRPMVYGFKPKDLIPIPWMVAMALQADGWWLRSDIIWHKPNCMPESVQDRPTTSHEYLFLLAKSKRYFYDGDAIREPNSPTSAGNRREFRGGGSYTNGNSFDNVSIKGNATPGNDGQHIGRNRRTVWTIPTKPYKGAHFATFPPALVEPCIKAGTSEYGVCGECGAQWEQVTEKKSGNIGGPTEHYINQVPRAHGQKTRDTYANTVVFDKSIRLTPKGGIEVQAIGWQPTCTCNAGDPIPATVLDPFVGSGTTCLIARQLGRRSIGLDLSFAYLRDQARARLELDRLAEWENGKQVEANWEELPLFQTS